MNKNLEKIRSACIKSNPERYKVISDMRIGLADVLLAWDQNGRHQMAQTDQYELFRIFEIWNLRKDDLTEQSEETITFLSDLLAN